MQEFFNRNIKELLQQYPAMGAVLSRYEIDCTTCQVGTCQLKDIIAIHNLSQATEKALFSELAAVMNGNGNSGYVPAASTGTDTPSRPLKRKFDYSPPLKKLVREHVLIKRWLTLIPLLCEGFAPERRAGTHPEVIIGIIRKGLAFIKNYADKFHHAKEEDVLFKYFDGNLEIIKAMLQEHTQARGYVKTITDALAAHDYQRVAETLKLYQNLLEEHIKKEDEILYPWMDRQLSTRQVGELYNTFSSLDAQSADMAQKEAAFIEELEGMFAKEEAKA